MKNKEFKPNLDAKAVFGKLASFSRVVNNAFKTGDWTEMEKLGYPKPKNWDGTKMHIVTSEIMDDIFDNQKDL